MKNFETKSEEIFFALCKDNGWVVRKMETAGKRTPDYSVLKDGIAFIAEVKELWPAYNTARKPRDRPGHKLRKAINRARAQLKDHDLPTLLVVLDISDAGYADAEQTRSALQNNPNAEISAVGILRHDGEKWGMDVHHNPQATHPFPA